MLLKTTDSHGSLFVRVCCIFACWPTLPGFTIFVSCLACCSARILFCTHQALLSFAKSQVTTAAHTCRPTQQLPLVCRHRQHLTCCLHSRDAQRSEVSRACAPEHVPAWHQLPQSTDVTWPPAWPSCFLPCGISSKVSNAVIAVHNIPFEIFKQRHTAHLPKLMCYDRVDLVITILPQVFKHFSLGILQLNVFSPCNQRQPELSTWL